MNKLTKILLLLISTCIVLCAVGLFVSDKAIWGDGYIWLYKVLNTGGFTHDHPSKRFITYFSQILPVIGVFFKQPPYIVLNLFLMNQLLVYLFLPVLFIYKYIKSRDIFYFCPLFAFVLMNISTDSFLVNVANNTSMVSWLLLDIVRKDKQTITSNIIIFLICSILMFSYETVVLMAGASIVCLIMKNIKKARFLNKEFVFQFIVINAIIISNLYIVLSIGLNTKTHTHQFWVSLIKIPSEQGIFVFIALAFYVGDIFTNKFKKIVFSLLVFLSFTWLYYRYANTPIGIPGIFFDAYDLRTLILPVSTMIGLGYVFFKHTPDLRLIALLSVILTFFSLKASFSHYNEVNKFKELLSTVDQCLIIKSEKMVNKFGFSFWNYPYKSVVYSQSRKINKLITLDSKSSDNCEENFLFTNKPTGQYFMYD